MIRRSIWGILGIVGILSLMALYATAAPVATPEPLTDLSSQSVTDLSSLKLAAPTSPGPTLEAEQIALTQYAIDSGALSETFDPDTGVDFILFPQGSNPEPPATDLPVRLVTAKYSKAQYDAAVEAVTARSWAPDAEKYAYGIGIDAAAGVVAVDTTAPPDITSAIAARYPGILTFNYVSGMTRLGQLASPRRRTSAPGSPAPPSALTR